MKVQKLQTDIELINSTIQGTTVILNHDYLKVTIKVLL